LAWIAYRLYATRAMIADVVFSFHANLIRPNAGYFSLVSGLGADPLVDSAIFDLHQTTFDNCSNLSDFSVSLTRSPFLILFFIVHSTGSVMHRPFFPMLNTFLLGFFNIGYNRIVIVFIGYDIEK